MKKYENNKRIDINEYKGMVELRNRNRLKSNYFFDDESNDLAEIIENREYSRLQQLTDWFQNFIEDDSEKEISFPLSNTIRK